MQVARLGCLAMHSMISGMISRADCVLPVPHTCVSAPLPCLQVRVVEFTSASSFREQLEMAAGTGLFVSVHTSNLANALWLPPGAAVVEILQRNWAWEGERRVAVGLRWMLSLQCAGLLVAGRTRGRARLTQCNAQTQCTGCPALLVLSRPALMPACIPQTSTSSS